MSMGLLSAIQKSHVTLRYVLHHIGFKYSVWPPINSILIIRRDILLVLLYALLCDKLRSFTHVSMLLCVFCLHSHSLEGQSQFCLLRPLCSVPLVFKKMPDKELQCTHTTFTTLYWIMKTDNRDRRAKHRRQLDCIDLCAQRC